MRLYFAAAVGSGASQGEDSIAADVRNRLVTFADGTPSAEQARTFWIRERERAMRLYVAGNAVQEGSEALNYEIGCRNRLLSYAFLDDWARKAFLYWVEHGQPDHSLFLDCGAFSAFTKKAVIDLDEYCAYIEAHASAITAYAALDVIGDWRATLANLDVMLKRGLHPVPCFHRGEPWEILDALARDHPYIALGGMVGGDGTRGTTSEDSLRPYLDACWRRIGRHWPVKVHAYGVMAQWVLERYPFYSADSSNAIMGAGMGRVNRFAAGQLKSEGWQDDVKRTLDGVVADGIGRTGAKSQSAHAGRRRRNVEAQLALERYVTDLWAAKGVAWED